MGQVFRALLIACTFAGYVQCFTTFEWPNPQLSYADKQLYEGRLSVIVQNCPSRDNSTIPAQWLRIAYHDMATHNVDDGTGGLDASIQYELDRPQNIGKGMTESLRDFSKFFTIAAPFFGMADLIALGAVLAVKGCGGPLIPFRAGRIDATSAGPATVPEPDQDLASHTESFRQQGFTPTEMISLVACGHTLGGVRNADFPQIVNDTFNTDVGTFDSTPAFDTAVLSEYLQNTTKNPLVVGSNVTTRSDLRIFSSDGNATMQGLLNPDAFNKTCGSLIERMINTVPSGVKLTDPIAEPFDYVVSEPLFGYQNGSLFMATTLRVLNSNPSRTVSMFWADRQGSSCPSTGCSVQSSSFSKVTFSIIGQAQGVTADRYSFNATINANSSISKFWFEINENDGSAPITVDNGGSGFVIKQDSVFVDNNRSIQEFVVEPDFNVFVKLVVAVRGDTSSSVSITTFDAASSSTTPPFTPTISTTQLQLDARYPPEAGFTFFTTNITTSVTFLDLKGTVSGSTYTQGDFDMTVVNLPIQFAG